MLSATRAKYHKTPVDSDVLVNTEPQSAPRRNAVEKNPTQIFGFAKGNKAISLKLSQIRLKIILGIIWFIS